MHHPLRQPMQVTSSRESQTAAWSGSPRTCFALAPLAAALLLQKDFEQRQTAF
ncbi:MAG: hypothetical protein ACT4P7_03990 [Gemmatimonadaceae bacterium]